MQQFRRHGVITAEDGELFRNPSWLAVYLGQGIVPQKAPAMTALREGVPVAERIEDVRLAIDAAANAMPSHEDFVSRYAAAGQR
jgi:tryptophan halogenase